MKKTEKKPEGKIAFIFDDRLQHDRKAIFTRSVSILKGRFPLDVLPSSLGEDEVLAALQTTQYSLILLPWYKYLQWKKVESFFGTLRMQGPTVAGYFADAILPFEFMGSPNFHRAILLDFYRLEQAEIEMLLMALLHEDRRTGFHGIQSKNTTLYHGDWRNADAISTQCIDAAMKIPLLHNGTWASRSMSLRFYLTALWSICFQNQKSKIDHSACAQLEIGEFNKRLAIKLNFTSTDLTLKNMIEYLWPSNTHENLAVHELVRFSDFLRVHHFPESHQIEITAYFSSSAPSLRYPGEVRGFWIEPLKKKYMNAMEEDGVKRIPIQNGRSEKVSENLHSSIEALRQVLIQTHSQINTIPHENKVFIESQVSNLRFLITELEKRISEKKKVA